MNPHYNQQHPYYNYQQHVPGPPQPPWQGHTPQSPSGWHDPRYQNIPPASSQTPQYGPGNSFGPLPNQPSHHSLPPPAPSATPGIPGLPPQPTPRPQEGYHKPSLSQYDTSQWGVKYNQAQHSQYPPEGQPRPSLEHKPALPPRPGSSLSYNAQPLPAAGDFQPSQAQYQPQGPWNTNFGQPQDQDAPTPPPRPAAYAVGPQYGAYGMPQEQYSHHAPSHHYDPQVQPQPQPQPYPQYQDQYSHHASTHHYDPPSQPSPGWQQPQPQLQHQVTPQPSSVWSHSSQGGDGPVSPMEDEKRRNSIARRPVPQYIDVEPPSQNVQLPTKSTRASKTATPEVQTSATAFGGFMGGLSDWQHYEPAEHQINEEEAVIDTPVASIRRDSFAATPLQPTKSIKRKSIERLRPQSKPDPPYQQEQTVREDIPGDRIHRLEPEIVAPTYPLPPLSHGPERQDSNSSTVSSMSGAVHNDSIDNVIQAWSAPLRTEPVIQTSQTDVRAPSLQEQIPIVAKTITHDREAQTDFEPKVETRVETRVETKEVEVDPYADIQNQYKATLTRFASMLRLEAAAEGDEEKFKIFQGFVIRELRLRSVLYGVETAPPETPAKPVVSEKVVQPTSPVSKPLESNQRDNTSAVAREAQTPPPPRLPTLDTQGPQTPNSKDDSYVLVGDDEYSPGGRPRIATVGVRSPKSVGATKPPAPTSTPAPIQTQPVSGLITLEPGQMSPSMNAPMTLDDYVTDIQLSPSANAPMVVGADNILGGPTNAPLAGPLNFSPSRPTYQPFRYSDRTISQVPAVQVHPPSESFASLRQTQATESGRTLVHDTPPVNIDSAPNRGHSKTPSGGRREHEEAFIGLIRAKSQAIRKKANGTPRPESPAILRAGTPAARPTPTPPPISPLAKSVQSLRAIVPASLPPPKMATPAHPKLEPIIASLKNLPDEFSFIHSRVLSWDRSNRQVRAKQDAERQERQSQYEEHNDHLFNENQIGYAEIPRLEKQFLLEEANKKYKDDQAELESFTKVVFDHVVEKMDNDIQDLTRLQTNAIDLLDLESASAAKQMQRSISQSMNGASSSPSALVTDVMQVLLEIHNKAEIRHMKIAEASFERERRRKRLESSILYTNNDKAGIKKLEAEFATAERLQILEEFRKKSERANRLLDSFDRAVVRGLAENQGAMDDVSTKLQLLRDLVMGSEENGPQGPARQELLYGTDGVKELVDRTSAMIDYILADSQSLVQLLDKADVLSNDADFDLYISEAKLTDASPEKFEKLKSEKEAEDRKVGEELASRLNGIARVPNEVSVLVREVRDKIGADVGHEERIGKALEAAKRRNTGFGA